MFGKKSTDLTTPDAVEKSQKVYDRIKSGQVKDVSRELKKAHGQKRGN